MSNWQTSQDGWNQASIQDVMALNKALQAGQAINNPGSTPGEGFALRREALDDSLKIAVYAEKQIKLMKMLTKLGATNTIQEFNRLESYGPTGMSGFIAEGDLPVEQDGRISRNYLVVRYLGTTRRVTDVMTLINAAHGPAVARETTNGSRWLVRQVETALYFGSNAMNPLEWDGFIRQIEVGAPSNVIDWRGKAIGQELLLDLATQLVEIPNNADPTHIHLRPLVFNDFVKSFLPTNRNSMNEGGFIQTAPKVKSIPGPNGDIEFVPNVFVNDGDGFPGGLLYDPDDGTTLIGAGNASRIPGIPEITVQPAAAADGDSKFGYAGASDGGLYFYAVVAGNGAGISAAVQADAAVSVANGDGVTIGVTPAPGQPQPVFYLLYRTTKDGEQGTERFIGRFANTAGMGEMTLTDLNDRLPGCTSVCMFEQTTDSMALLQLCPMVRMPLGRNDTSLRWMQLYYAVPALYLPRHNAVIKNVGRLPGRADRDVNDIPN